MMELNRGSCRRSAIVTVFVWSPLVFGIIRFFFPFIFPSFCFFCFFVLLLTFFFYLFSLSLSLSLSFSFFLLPLAFLSFLPSFPTGQNRRNESTADIRTLIYPSICWFYPRICLLIDLFNHLICITEEGNVPLEHTEVS